MAGKGRDILFDVSRLLTRFSRCAPNGIDRVDLGYAQHMLTPQRAGLGVLASLGAPRAIEAEAARAAVDAIASHWRETGSYADDPEYHRLLAWLTRSDVPNIANAQTRPSQRPLRTLISLLRNRSIFGRQGLFPGQSLISRAPPDSIYLNISQFPLWIDGYFRWLDKRPDIRPIFFIHDLLPTRYPEFFPVGEAARHASRLSVLAKRAAGVVVSSETTRSMLERYLQDKNARVPPICVNPLPVEPSFRTSQTPDPTLSKHRYFATVGTIEPRKNHLLLLHIWREITASLGAKAPKLVIIGTRGWDCENVADILDRCDMTRSSVLELGHVSTPALGHIMAHADALLMPTFAEGYGLPVTEALSAGVPVIASDIDAFRPFDGDMITKIDPIDGLEWMRQIFSRAHRPKRRLPSCINKNTTHSRSWSAHISRFEEFAATI